MFKLGTSEIGDVYLGTTEIGKAYLGTTLVYEKNKVYIIFEDPNVESVCISNWSKDGIGVTQKDVLKATNIRTKFAGNTDIQYFDEFVYFTNATDALSGNDNLTEGFRGCSNLKYITLPPITFTTGVAMFRYCSSLERITITDQTRLAPDSLGNATTRTFQGCTNLKRFNIPSIGVWLEFAKKFRTNAYTSYFSLPFCVSREGHLYIDNNEVTTCTTPSTITYIPGGAFSFLINLQSVTLNNVITSIGEFAFINCSSLTQITLSTSLATTGKDCFDGCTSLNKLYITDLEKFLNITWNSAKSFPFGGNSNGGTLYINNVAPSSITVPSSITALKDRAFYRCKNITSVSIPSTVTSLGYDTFSQSGIVSLTIPSSVTSIMGWCFYQSTSLESITIPSSVTTIGSQCFTGCTALTSLTIPSSVTSLGAGAIVQLCSSLVNFTNYSTQELTGSANAWNCGNGTGVFETYGNITRTGAWGLSFKKVIIHGNLSQNSTYFLINNSSVEQVIIDGDYVGSTADVSGIQDTYSTGESKLGFVEIGGTVTSGKVFYHDNYQGLKNGCILHLSYNGVAGTPTNCNANFTRLATIYVGPGTSQAGDTAILNQYLADTDWANYSSKLDIWYNYTGEYKNS